MVHSKSYAVYSRMALSERAPESQPASQPASKQKRRRAYEFP